MIKHLLLTIAAVLGITFGYSQSGRVGIGTSAPKTKLDVAGAISTSEQAVSAGSNLSINTNISLFRITNVSGTQTNSISANAPAEGQLLIIVNEDDDDALFAGSAIKGNGGSNSYIYANGNWRLTGTSQVNTGPQGITGPKGDTGNDGAVGAQGAKGDKGDKGDTGNTGAAGAQGVQGIKGDKGDKGDQGNTGAQGSVGPQGPQGPTGFLQNGTATGQTPYWNGSAWVIDQNIYNNGGNVGIGTSSPSQKLDVNGGLRTAAGSLTILNDYIYVSPTNKNTLNSGYNENTTADMWVNYRGYNDGMTQSRNFNIGDGKGANIAWFDGVNRRVSINNGQTANYPLDVAGDINSSTGYRIGGNAASGNYLRGNGSQFVSSAIQASDIPDLSGSYIKNQNSLAQSGNFWIDGDGRFNVDKGPYWAANTDAGFVRFHSTGDAIGQSWLEIGTADNGDEHIAFTQTGAERMRIHTNGNVGIGATNPTHKLEVYGSDNVAYFASSGSNAYIRLAVNNDINTRLELANRNGRTALWNPIGGDIFNIIHSSGNVGIGTTTPSNKLQVAAGDGQGIDIGIPNDAMGFNGGSNSIRFYGYRDVVSNAIGAKISAERTDRCCGWLSQGTELAFYTNDGLTTSNADNSIERVRIRDYGTLEAKAGLQTERHIRFYKRSRGNGQGGEDVLGNYDFCYLAGVAFRNSDSNVDEDDDYQCNVYSYDINGAAGPGEGQNQDFAANFGYNSRPYWRLYSECYQDCSNATCTAMCINFDY